MSRWLIRLAFPALGLLLAAIIVGVKAPETVPESPGKARESTALPSFEALVPAPVASQGPDIVFKWQGPDGSWHYADQPPEEGPWNTLAIQPGRDTQPLEPMTPYPTGEALNAPYSAPFALDPRHPSNGS